MLCLMIPFKHYPPLPFGFRFLSSTCLQLSVNLGLLRVLSALSSQTLLNVLKAFAPHLPFFVNLTIFCCLSLCSFLISFLLALVRGVPFFCQKLAVLRF